MMHAIRSLCCSVVLVAVPLVAQAQSVTVTAPPGTRTRTVATTATVTIGGVFTFTPATPVLTQTTGQANICNPGACFASSLSVAANQRWQLQVRVRPTAPNNFYVNWITPAPQTQIRLNSTWTTIRSATTTSTGTAVALMFNANKASGNGGNTPSAAQLTSYLEYQVIALP